MDEILVPPDSLPRIAKRPHTSYAQSSELEDVIFALSSEWIPYGYLSQVHMTTGIPLQTLSDWRQRLVKDIDWRPWGRDYSSQQSLPPVVEKSIADYVRDNFISCGKPCPISELRILALNAYSTGGFEYQRSRFCASYRWVKGFLARHKLSLRRPVAARRGEIDENYVQVFLWMIKQAATYYPPWRIWNMDETSWRFINCPQRVIAEKGQENVKIETSGSEKKSFSAIGTVSMDGKKLPVWIIVKGKTRRCLVKMGHVDAELTFSENGWSTKDVMIKYLQWLSERSDGEPCCLVWDVYKAHLVDEVWQCANNLDIHIITVPANGTGAYQPLDHRIFGILKSYARREFIRLKHLGQFDETDQMAARILCDCWNRISKEQIISGWRCLTDAMKDKNVG